MLPPIEPADGPPGPPEEQAFWDELARLRAIAGIKRPGAVNLEMFRTVAEALRQARAVASGRCSPNPGRWRRTRASRKFVRRLVERLQPD